MQTKLKKRSIKYHLLEFVRYSCVGISSTILQLFFLYLVTEYLNLYYLFSSILVYVFVGFYNFLLNKTWTFREKLGHGIIIKYLKFLGLDITSFASNILLLYVFTEYVHVYYVTSQYLAILLIAIMRYTINKFVIFKK